MSIFFIKKSKKNIRKARLTQQSEFVIITSVMRIQQGAAILILALMMPGCSLEKRLEDVSKDVEQQYAKAKVWKQLPQRTISWNQAIAMIRTQNTDIKQADNDIAEAERRALSVYTDMIPSASYYGYFNKSLKELTNSWSTSDLQSNINVHFSLPSLTQLPYRVYAAEATTFAAKKAKEGKERELTAQLYEAVRRRDLAKRKARHEKKKPDEKDDILIAEQEESANEEYWQKMAKLLGDYSARWEILPESTPKVSWSKYKNKLHKLDELVVCQFAMKLEQSRMAQYRVALQYLPTINTSLYSPSLFSSTGGTYSGTFLDTDDTKLNMSISYNLDTHLDTWNQYKDSKEQYELTKQEVSQEIMEHKVKTEKLRRSYEKYSAWKQYMHKRIGFLRSAPADTGTDFIERANTLHQMEQELLNQEEKAIESEAALVLGYGL